MSSATSPDPSGARPPVTSRPIQRTMIKRILAVAVIVGSIAFLIYYWRANPGITTQLRSVNPLTGIGLLALYLCMTAVLTALYGIMVRMCGKRLQPTENTLLTMYSSIINFFGPLQSGPGFRIVYLKKRHNISVGTYTAANLLYYALFAISNVVFLAFGLIPLRFAPLVVVLLAGLAWLLWRNIPRIPFVARRKPALNGKLFAAMAVLTLAQALLVVIIYFIELHALGVAASLQQAVVYAGAANLALFVSLTPGALGFRESFLYFSQQLHHIPNSTIIAANVLDRAVYLAFLGCLGIIILSMHAGKRLGVREIRRDQ